MEHYMGVRWQTIDDFIVTQPIFDFCVEGERKHGTSPRQWWWDQPMDLEAARGAAAAAAMVAANDGEAVVGGPG